MAQEMLMPKAKEVVTGSGSGGGARFLGARPMPDLSDDATRQVMPLG